MASYNIRQISIYIILLLFLSSSSFHEEIRFSWGKKIVFTFSQFLLFLLKHCLHFDLLPSPISSTALLKGCKAGLVNQTEDGGWIIPAHYLSVLPLSGSADVADGLWQTSAPPPRSVKPLHPSSGVTGDKAANRTPAGAAHHTHPTSSCLHWPPFVTSFPFFAPLFRSFFPPRHTVRCSGPFCSDWLSGF